MIHYSGGGHPPVVLVTGPADAEPAAHLLDSKGPMVGAISDLEYDSGSITVEPFSRLFLFSDGAYEIERADGSMWPFSEFIEFMKHPQCI